MSVEYKPIVWWYRIDNVWVMTCNKELYVFLQIKDELREKIYGIQPKRVFVLIYNVDSPLWKDKHICEDQQYFLHTRRKFVYRYPFIRASLTDCEHWTMARDGNIWLK